MEHFKNAPLDTISDYELEVVMLNQFSNYLCQAYSESLEQWETCGP